ncbi:hypothetical protein [Streptomyces spongiae]|uniref:Uncharacterized protein n=1 Tax=Streptomyces spongiae TaxID=565072 RepID=A0A5N8Y0B8_9ACTN|nr:hypothetical protein [Streptomyces spongiae]MPY65034.1 hypothetical protein [Streptomyces spongiae]
MRARLLLTGIALGATMLVGGAATAQAAPAASAADTASIAQAAAGWEYIGTFKRAECISLKNSYAGEAKCDAIGSGWYELWVKTG